MERNLAWKRKAGVLGEGGGRFLCFTHLYSAQPYVNVRYVLAFSDCSHFERSKKQPVFSRFLLRRENVTTESARGAMS